MSRTNTHPQTLQVISPPTSLGATSYSESEFWDMAPDDELICIFIRSNSNDALETLIRRHGPMVARLLGRLLSHPQDREDAFQATFLIFVKSIHRIRKKNSVCSFLMGVALRTGKRLRSQRIANSKKLAAEANLDLLPNPGYSSPFELLALRRSGPVSKRGLSCDDRNLEPESAESTSQRNESSRSKPSAWHRIYDPLFCSESHPRRITNATHYTFVITFMDRGRMRPFGRRAWHVAVASRWRFDWGADVDRDI